MCKIFLLLLGLLPFCSYELFALTNRNSPQIETQSLRTSCIIHTNNLNDIEAIVDHASENTLVLWDVDQTLIVPDDAILKPKWEKQLDQWLGGKKFTIDASGKKRYVFREILMSAPHSIIDSHIFPLIQKIQDKHIPTIAFSAAPGGKVGQADRFIDWRVQELNAFGFDFSHSFPAIESVHLPKDPDLEFPPMYQSGVLITSLHEKGPVLLDFFQAIQWTPQTVIFIDDQLGNVQSVVQSLDGQTKVIGVHYTAASELPCELEEAAAHSQVDHFLKTGEWTSQGAVPRDH